jgi:ABC-2 type transport system ATP-binding protein
MHEADRLCDRIAIIDHGRVIALDTPRGLRRLLPGEQGLELVLGGGDGYRDAFAGLGRVELSEPQDGRRQVRLYGAAQAGDALAAAERAGADVLELRRIEGTLEDVFVHLTGRELR